MSAYSPRRNAREASRAREEYEQVVVADKQAQAAARAAQQQQVAARANASDELLKRLTPGEIREWTRLSVHDRPTWERRKRRELDAEEAGHDD